MPYMLDADTCIYIINRNERISPQAELADCVISQIVLGELAYGVAKSAPARRANNERSLLDFLGSIEVYPLSNQATSIYGAIRADLEREGQVIGANDFWIAAHAIAADLQLVTNNTREFSRVPNLTIDTWMIG